MSYRPRAQPEHGRAEVARRIRDSLRDEIRAARYSNGVLPSESALMAREDASRTAIRMALNMLKSEGLIRRRQGIGTVAVKDDQVCVPLDPPQSVARICAESPYHVSYLPLSLVCAPATASVADRLGIKPHGEAVFMERLTLINGAPLSVACVWIPYAHGAPLLAGAADIESQGIFDILEQALHLHLGRSEYSIEATTADESIAALLDLPLGGPLLLLGSLTFQANGDPAAFGYTRARPDRLRYEFRAVRELGESEPGVRPESVARGVRHGPLSASVAPGVRLSTQMS